MLRAYSFVLLALYTLYSNPLSAVDPDVDFRDFDAYSGTVSRVELERRYVLHLRKSPEIDDHVLFTADRVVFYASRADKDAGREEYRIDFGDKPKPRVVRTPRLNPAKPLEGLRIAIDPGHYGGPLAVVPEARYIEMQEDAKLGIPAGTRFDEGTLTLVTAKYLQQLLEAKGASVLLSREKIGTGILPLPWAQWRVKEMPAVIEEKVASLTDPVKRDETRQWWLAQPEVDQFRLLYNPLDLRARVDRLAAFKPDAMVSIHFNSGHPVKPFGRDSAGRSAATTDNYSMVFAPGSFMKGELASKKARYAFVRLLVTDELDQSIRLSGCVARALEKTTGVALIDDTQAKSLGYLTANCLPTSERGVQTRNLGVITGMPGAACMGEAFCQENAAECLRLAKQDFTIDGVTSSSRLKTVAEAYEQALLHYFAD